MKIIINVAIKKGAPYYILNKDYFVSNIRLDKDKTTFDYTFNKYGLILKDLQINLLGYHQAYNSAVALTSFLLYFDKINRKFYEDKLREALFKVNWIGRFQLLSKNPFVIIDGAHNEEGVSALIKNLKLIFPEYKYHFLLSILKDKNLENMIKEICSVAEKVYISKNLSERAADIQEQVDVVVSCGTEYQTGDDIVKLTNECICKLKQDEMLIITGSLYTISEVLKQGISCELS